MATDKPDAKGGEKPMSMKERLLAKRRAEAQAQAQASAPPVPAAKPAARSAEPAPARAPAPRAAEPEPQPAARSAARAPARPAPAPEKPARSVRGQRKSLSPDVLREVQMLKKREDKWVMYGWIVAGTLVLAAGGIWLYVQAKKQQIIDNRLAYEKSVDDVVQEILAISPTTIENANKIIARAEATRLEIPVPGLPPGAGWKDTYVDGAAGKIVGHVNRASTFVQDETRRRELIEGLAAVEAAARDASNKKPEELAQLRRRLGEYEQGGSLVGAEFEARVAKVKIDINRAYVRRLYDEAVSLAAKGPSESRAALQAFQKAEDEIRSMLDEAYTKRQQEAIDWVTPLYEQCIAESDKLVYTVFTPDTIDKTPWRDLLTPGTEWLNDGLSGFRTDGGVVHAVGAAPGSKREGIFSVGDREKWRDFVMEIEFTPIKGQTHFFWRLGRQTSTAPDDVLINLQADDGWKAGQSYTMNVSYIGSRRKFEYSANADRDPDHLDPINWRRNRAGAFGVTLAEASEIKITKLRIKVLR